ncbi:TPA: hypothetical protein CPT80_03965 [Candidatus Gastranaerophilales bacterium HUM_9]|nr:MAG TPA: hypothetical protein CPT80_03965 [Candidatus Gastranaerophilales bacterium HUM_9]HBX34142.1 DUF1292 domain-containing protein [Cyanobacteria bacterium UBA11440]
MADIEDKDNLVETVDEDGNVITFRLFDIIEFENKEYALLLPADSDDDEEDSEIVIMKLIKEDEEYSFETIDSDEEFDRVSTYLEELSEEE